MSKIQCSYIHMTMRKAARSGSICFSTAGFWTLTATQSPAFPSLPFNRARCTWAMLALATAVSSNSAKRPSGPLGGRPNSSRKTRATSAKGTWGASSNNRENLTCMGLGKNAAVAPIAWPSYVLVGRHELPVTCQSPNFI